MANEIHNDMTSVWKNQSLEKVEISLEQLRGKAQKLEKRVWQRNLREYVASAIVVAAFAYYIWLFPSPLVRLGCVLVIAGTLFMVCVLLKKGSARNVPAQMGMRSCVEFHREELLRQRDLLRGVWTWYLLPLVPGLALFLAGLFRQTMQQPNASAHAGAIIATFSFTTVVCALVFVGIGKLNQWAARKLQCEIDALDAMHDKS